MHGELVAYTSDSRGTNELAAAICSSFARASADVLPLQELRPAKPWISADELALIYDRNQARRAGDYAAEKRLSKAARKRAQKDRAKWLDAQVSDGSWSAIRKLRRPRGVSGRPLKNTQGQVVESAQRAETVAEYFEKVQWADRHCSSAPLRPALGSTQPICTGPITEEEVKNVVRKLKTGKATTDVAAEYLKALAACESPSGWRWIVELMQLCWETKTTPRAWHLAQVVTIFKKGSPQECANYRPISLLSILYKVYASILLNRLKVAGAEQRLWSRQFGFRFKRSSEDALFVVRRRIEQARASRTVTPSYWPWTGRRPLHFRTEINERIGAVRLWRALRRTNARW